MSGCVAEREPKLYAIPAAMAFAEEIREHLSCTIQPMNVTTFACGETRVDIENSVRGENVYLIGWGVGWSDGPGQVSSVNENLMQVLVAVNAFKLASAGKITVVFPNLPYSRQDRKDASRQPITSKLLADMLKVAGCNHLITMDLHAAQIQGFYDFPADNLYGSPHLVGRLSQVYNKGDPIAVVSPDAGGRKRVEDTIDRLRRSGFQDVEMVYMHKKRDPRTGEVIRQELIGDPTDRYCILVDDMGDTCGTLISAAQKLREECVQSVVAAVTHGVFSRDAITRLSQADCPVERTYVTDTCVDAGHFTSNDRIVVVSVAKIFADAIYANHTNGSVSHLFT